MKISWKFTLRVLAVISLLIAIGWVYFQPGFEPILAFLGALVAFITSFFVQDIPREDLRKHAEITLYDSNCGSKGIDLGNQRLRVSAAFGSYFLSLLEREQSYITLPGQLDCPFVKGQEGLSPIQRIFWSLQNPKGAKLLFIAADGGMGKSTLASKLVRCLYEQEVVDMILGDSAKSETIDPVSGHSLSHLPGYQTASGFYHRLCLQLGVPYESDEIALKDIQRRLVNRRAIIVVDNLETVTHRDEVVRALMQITSRDIRAIITTRQATDINSQDPQLLLIRLNPLKELETIREFLDWHSDQYQQTHPALSKIRSDSVDKKQLYWLVEKSGGIPLLIQLLVSDVARSSWEQMRQLPTLFGVDLLNYLYMTRWQDLNQCNNTGLFAQDILLWINQEQLSNRRVSSKRLDEWAKTNNRSDLLSPALALLYERFMIINSDLKKGNFAIFPSLSEFLQHCRKSLPYG